MAEKVRGFDTESDFLYRRQRSASKPVPAKRAERRIALDIPPLHDYCPPVI
ncbi:MAG: hypothetical protein LBH00_12385 [Planctomycetaceae bacterium]|nr:hypothetical protein [Planctomycetaceae bacterium]